jgi:protein gp37
MPLRWRKPRTVFVCSMGDLFHAQVPDEFTAQVFAVMALARAHTFMVLTKRHRRMASLLSSPKFQAEVAGAVHTIVAPDGPPLSWPGVWPLPNVWAGVSAENQYWAGIRVPALAAIPAVKRFVSAEPLLGPVELPGPAGCGVDWVIAGAETGPGARPADPDWFRSLRDQSARDGVRFFLKALGPRRGRVLDGRVWDDRPSVS